MVFGSNEKTAEKLLPVLQQACEQYPQHAEYPAAIVKVGEQALYLFIDNKYFTKYSVSTSRHGVGQLEGSYQTPLGVHCVKEKIGASANLGEIFVSREPCKSIAVIEHDAVCTEKECITSRILWLSGLEQGFNKGLNTEGKCVDSHDRFIYIHGTHEEGLIGQAASIGCVRMKNKDVIDLFDHLQLSSLVIIEN